MARKSRICWGLRHEFWMAKLRVVEARNFDGIAGFGRGVERFVGFGLPVGCGVVLGAEIKGL